jgi:hypothetical protein
MYQKDGVRMSSPLRRAVERRSTAPLTWLSTQPRWVPFVLVLALLLGGLFTPPGIGVALLAILGLLLGWITYLAWPRLDNAGRLVRGLVIVLVVGVLVQRIGQL